MSCARLGAPRQWARRRRAKRRHTPNTKSNAAAATMPTSRPPTNAPKMRTTRAASTARGHRARTATSQPSARMTAATTAAEPSMLALRSGALHAARNAELADLSAPPVYDSAFPHETQEARTVALTSRTSRATPTTPITAAPASNHQEREDRVPSVTVLPSRDAGLVGAQSWPPLPLAHSSVRAVARSAIAGKGRPLPSCPGPLRCATSTRRSGGCFGRYGRSKVSHKRHSGSPLGTDGPSSANSSAANAEHL